MDVLHKGAKLQRAPPEFVQVVWCLELVPVRLK
jgi:hypothetical protein